MNYGKMSGTISRLTSDTQEFIESLRSSYKSGTQDGGNVIRGLFFAARELAAHIKTPLYVLCGILLSSAGVTEGAYPFGAALLSSSPCRLNDSLPIYIGLLIGSLFTGTYMLANLIICTLVFALRLTAPFIFENPDATSLKMSSSLSAAVMSGVYVFVSSGVSANAFLTALMMLAVMPTLTFLYSGLFETEKISSSSFYREAGLSALTISLILALVGITILSLNISLLLSLTAVFIFVTRYGLFKGIVFSTAASFALSLTTGSGTLIIPVFAVIAAVYGVVRVFSPYFAVALAAMSSVSWALYSTDYISTAEIAPEIVTSGIIFVLLSLSGVFAPQKEELRKKIPDDVTLMTEKLRRESISGLLDAESEALSSLSEMLYRLSDKLSRPSPYDVREAVGEARIKVCRKCSRYDKCMNEDAAYASDAWDMMYRILYKTGTLDEESLPEYIVTDCINRDLLTYKMSAAYSSLLRGLIEGDKFEVMANDYGAASEVLREALDVNTNEGLLDAAASSMLSAAFTEEKIKAERICVFGRRARTIYISNLKLMDLHVGEDDIRRLSSRVCGGAFSSPRFDMRGNEINATLSSVRAYKADFYKSCTKKEDSSVNGDSALSFECRDDRYAVILSDGMGSGHDAALTSGMCCMFIERMMSSGCSAGVTLRLLNSMLRARRTECSSTIDLCEIDLISGKATFIKSGASPSFIIRGTSIYKISSHTLPIGIISAADAEKTVVDICADDIIIMLSDGVTSGEDDPAWLYSMLPEERDKDLSQITEDILREARARGAKNDDATVCAVRTSPSDDSIFI